MPNDAENAQQHNAENAPAGPAAAADPNQDLLARLVAALEARNPAPQTSQVFVNHGRKVTVFRDRPTSSSDPSVDEWITDAERQIAVRKLSGPDATAFVVEHLSGRARQEVLGRGLDRQRHEDIFKVLKAIFGDGLTLGQLRSRFFSYRQQPGDDVVTCSLELVSLMDKILKLEPTATASRNTMLRERLAEAVTDPSTQQEFRRLLDEDPALDFFEARDRVLRWKGTGKSTSCRAPSEASVQEVASERSETDDLTRAVLEMSKQVAELITVTRSQESQASSSSRRRPGFNAQGERVCFRCRSPGHMLKDCPVPREQPGSESPTVAGNGSTQQKWAALLVMPLMKAHSWRKQLAAALRPPSQ